MTCDPDQMGSQQVLSCMSSAVYHSFFPTISPGFSLPVKVLVGPKGEHKESTSQLNIFLPFLFFVVFFFTYRLCCRFPCILWACHRPSPGTGWSTHSDPASGSWGPGWTFPQPQCSKWKERGKGALACRLSFCCFSFRHWSNTFANSKCHTFIESYYQIPVKKIGSSLQCWEKIIWQSSKYLQRPGFISGKKTPTG